MEDLIELALNQKWAEFRGSVHYKMGDVETNITRERWRELIFSPCNVCGTTGTIFLVVRKRINPVKTNQKVNTVDRRDSSKGYTEGNVQTLCHDCNTYKNSHTQKEFDEIVNRLVDHQIKLRENNKPMDKINDVYSYSNQGYPH